MRPNSYLGNEKDYNKIFFKVTWKMSESRFMMVAKATMFDIIACHKIHCLASLDHRIRGIKCRHVLWIHTVFSDAKSPVRV